MEREVTDIKAMGMGGKVWAGVSGSANEIAFGVSFDIGGGEGMVKSTHF